jgi:tRNA1(Val) A37 N6-methylase TrmN6
MTEQPFRRKELDQGFDSILQKKHKEEPIHSPLTNFMNWRNIIRPLRDTIENLCQTATESEHSLAMRDLRALQKELNGDEQQIPSAITKFVEWCFHVSVNPFKLNNAAVSSKAMGVLELVTEEFLTQHTHPETHLLTMTINEATSLKESIPREIFNTVLRRLIRKGLIAFPFKKYFELPPKELYSNLKTYEPIVSNKPFRLSSCRISNSLFPPKFNGDYFLWSYRKSTYKFIDVIGDLYTEEQRLKAVRADQKMSPMEYWKENSIKLIEELIRKGKDVSTKNLREELYVQVRECTQFKPTVAYSVYKILKANKILDISAGWGDRLIAAMAYGAKAYLGFDPNVELRTGHLNAVRELWGSDKSLSSVEDFPEEFQVIYEPFETATIPDKYKFDLCFSSPPYFDFEIYTKQATQSVERYPNFEEWMKKFLFASLTKAWKALDTGGYLAIHIADLGSNLTVEPMNLFIQYSLPGATYCGVIGTEGASTKILPIWVWNKTNKDDTTKKTEAELRMKKYYRFLYY